MAVPMTCPVFSVFPWACATRWSRIIWPQFPPWPAGAGRVKACSSASSGGRAFSPSSLWALSGAVGSADAHASGPGLWLLVAAMVVTLGVRPSGVVGRAGTEHATRTVWSTPPLPPRTAPQPLDPGTGLLVGLVHGLAGGPRPPALVLKELLAPTGSATSQLSERVSSGCRSSPGWQECP